jgi:GST-like protein
MIDLYFHPTPNGHKVAIFLEEAELPYRIRPVDPARGEQFTREFLLISPNNKIPAIVDHDPPDGGAPLGVFETGAILIYLAEKTGKFLPQQLRRRKEVLEWLTWQISGLGPMSGQRGHFAHAAPERIPYAMDRYLREVGRLYAVLDKRLTGREFIVDQYSIADQACYPFIAAHEHMGLSLAEFPQLERWAVSIAGRPSVKKAYEILKERTPGRPDGPPITDEMRRILWNQSAESVRRAWAAAGI